MNTLNNLPYMPTEIWDKIFDIKYSLEDKEEHKIKQNMVIEQFDRFTDELLCNYEIDDLLSMRESNNAINQYKIHLMGENPVRILKPSKKIDISVFSGAMIRWIEAESWQDVYDPLSITDDESDDDDYIYD